MRCLQLPPALTQNDGPYRCSLNTSAVHRTSIEATQSQVLAMYSCCSSPSTTSCPQAASSSGISDGSDQQDTLLDISSDSEHSSYSSGLQLQFHNISYWLKPAKASCVRRWLRYSKQDGSNKNMSTQQQEEHQVHGSQLLHDVNGTASSGRLLAVMGPSGAGKTTLLSLLAGDRDTLSCGHMSGRILLGGQQAQLKTSSSIHVKQDDALLSTTTPREALAFAAALKLPSPAFTRQQRAAAVEELLEGLKLTKCADTLVGDSVGGVKGLSGGERRRLSVAVELLGKPGLAMMDEPSSGQDSSTAQQVVSFIKQTVLCGHTASDGSTHPGILIITVHQPGSEITSLIDDLLLLTAEGRVAYCGPWQCALPYFEQHLQLSPPPHTGLAEWFLMLISNSEQKQQQISSDAIRRSVEHESSSSSQQLPGATPASSAVTSGCAALADAWRALTSAESNVDSSSNTVAIDGSSWSHQQQWLIMLRHCTSGGQLQNSGELLIQVVTVSSTDDDDDDESSARDTPLRSAANKYESTVDCDSQAVHQSNTVLKQIATPWPVNDDISISSSTSSRIKTARLDLIEAQPGSGSRSSNSNGPCRAGFWVQVCTLAGRTLRFWWRNPALVLSEAVQYLFVVVFVGSVYPRMSVIGQSAVVDRLAVMFMWMTALLVTAPSRALIAWDMERRLLRHELSSGSYSLTAFLVGTKLLTAVPLEATLVAAAAALLYFMLGLQATVVKFAAWLVLSVLCALSSSNMGNMIGLLTPDLNLALPILAVSATMLLAFAGFMVSVVPAWWSWMHEASFATYAYAGIVRNEFEGLVLQLPSADVLRPASGALGTNALMAAAQQKLQTAVAAVKHDSSGMVGSHTAAAAAANGTLAVDGLLVIPQTIKVHATSVLGFIGYMTMFFMGTTLLCIVCTVLMVRVRMR